MSFTGHSGWIESKTNNDYLNLFAFGYSRKDDNERVIAMSFSPVYLILYCVFLINLLILYFSFFKRGAEMLILRLGFPFVVSGWIDSDRGVFKPYIQQFINTNPHLKKVL